LAVKIGIFGDQRFLYDEQGRYYSRGNLRAVLLEEYVRQFDQVTLFFRTKASDLSWAPEADLIKHERIRFIHLPTFEGAFGVGKHANEIRARIDEHIDECDVCILRFCYQVSCLATELTARHNKPSIAHLRGDAGAAMQFDERIPTALLRWLAGTRLRSYYRKYVNRCDVILGTSKAVADLYAKAGRFTGGISDGCTTEAFFLPFRERQLDQPANIVVVARMNYAKNVAQLIQALGILNLQKLDCMLTVVGDGPNLPQLKALAESLGIVDKVRFLGRVDARADLVELLRDAHIGALTSRTEGLPSSVLESMAAALPIVATNLPCMKEIVNEGENGFLVEIGDAEACAERLGRLVRDESLRERMGRSAHERAKVFRTDRQVAKLRELAEDLLSHPGPR
jgi:glycosyltransferase involved in cell wall biosynthesis